MDRIIATTTSAALQGAGGDLTRDSTTWLRNWRWLVAVLAVLLALTLWQTVRWSRAVALDELRDSGARSLRLVLAGLQSELEKYEFLPRLLAQDTQIIGLLTATPDAHRTATVNSYLERVNESAGAADTYVMDHAGFTVAASNWASETSFMGQNFAFRPYFQAAMRGASGRYFALGTTSMRRGYYFAQPVLLGGEVLGAAVVKISIDRIEQAWENAPFAVVVTDRHGVVFSTNRPHWRYRTLQPLPEQTLNMIYASKQYVDRRLAALPVVSSRPHHSGGALITVLETVAAAGAESDAAAKKVTYLTQNGVMPEHQWRVHVWMDTSSVQQRVAIAVALVTLGFMILALTGVYLIQRRHRVQMELAHQQQVEDTLRRARDQLERRVEERTRELVDTNKRLRREIGERRRAENELREAQHELVQAAKLAALGQLSAGITHELNQPLAAILSYAQNAQAFLDRERYGDARSNLGIISELTERMARLTGHLKSFARKTDNVSSQFSVNEVLDNALRLLVARLRNDCVELTRSCLATDDTVTGDPIRLEQVFVNLLKNAIDAMEENKPRQLKVDIQRQDSSLVVDVTDSGPGIPEAVMSKLFDPFITTKPVGSGLGLGLSISYSIVSDMGGTIEASNQSEGGARFRVVLPATGEDHGRG